LIEIHFTIRPPQQARAWSQAGGQLLLPNNVMDFRELYPSVSVRSLVHRRGPHSSGQCYWNFRSHPIPWAFLWSDTYEGPSPFPTCEIRSTEHQSQFRLPERNINNRTLSLADVNPYLNTTDPTCYAWVAACPLDEQECALEVRQMFCYPAGILKRIIDIIFWMTLRNYRRNRGFFGDCDLAQVKDTCRDGAHLWKDWE
jgi:hypothetical protein